MCIQTIKKKYADLEYLETQFVAADHAENLTKDDWGMPKSHSRSTAVLDRKLRIYEEIERLKEQQQHLSNPNNLILIDHFLRSPDWQLSLSTPSEARNFELEFEKALNQTEKYLQPLIAQAGLPVVPFEIPADRWYESLWLVSPPGSGETNALLALINTHLPAVHEHQATVIVMDGQGKEQSLVYPLYRTFPNAIYIDPANPIPINPFLKDSSDHRIAFNAARDMLTYFMSGMVEQPLTSNHETVLENALELIFVIPDATLFTLFEILDPTRNNLNDFNKYIDLIDDPFNIIKRFLVSDLFNNPIFAPRRAEWSGGSTPC